MKELLVMKNTMAFRLYSLIVGIAMVLCGGVVLFYNSKTADWVETTGTIQGVTRTTERDTSGDSRTVYRYQLAYEVDGKQYSIRSQSGDSLRDGDTKALTYNPFMPDEAHEGGRYTLQAWLLIMIGIILLAVRIALFFVPRAGSQTLEGPKSPYDVLYYRGNLTRKVIETSVC